MVGDEELTDFFNEVSYSAADESVEDSNYMLPHCVSTKETVEIPKIMVQWKKKVRLQTMERKQVKGRGRLRL